MAYTEHLSKYHYCSVKRYFVNTDLSVIFVEKKELNI